MSQKGLIASYKFQEQRLNVGAELVADPSFDTPASWTSSGAGLVVTGGNLVFDDTSNRYIEPAVAEPLTVGMVYIFSFEIANSAGATGARFTIRNQAGTEIFAEIAETYSNYPDGEYSLILTCSQANTTWRLYINTDGDAFEMPDVSIKPALISDLTPNSNLMSIYGAGFTTDRKGLADSALDLDGTDDYLLGDDANFPTGNNSRTFTAWVKANATQDSWAEIFSYGAQVADQAFLVSVNDDSSSGKLQIGKWGLNSGQADTSIADDTWHHIGVVITQDGATDVTIAFYLDGVADGTSTLADVDTTLDGASQISTRPGNDDYWFKGAVDEVKFFDRALDATEMLAEYNTYQPDGALNTGSLQKGLVAHFPLRSKYNKHNADLLPNPDFTAVWAPTNVTVDSSIQFTADAAGGYLVYGGIISTGKTYIAHMAGSVSAGSINVKDGTATNKVLTGTFDEVFIYTAENVTFNFQLTDNGAVAIFNTLILEELTSADITQQGNHAEVWGADVQADQTVFDGTNHVGTVNDFNAVGQGEFIISLWIKPDDGIPGGSECIFGARESGAGNDRIQMYLGGTGVLACWYKADGNGTTAQTLSPVFSDGAVADFHHMVMHVGTTLVDIYLDGVKQTLHGTSDGDISTAIKANFDLAGYKPYIGARDDAGTADDFYEGGVDAVRIYKDSNKLGDIDAFVLALYNKGRS
jgi:hypothetical protein